jgi:hypothetical protein
MIGGIVDGRQLRKHGAAANKALYSVGERTLFIAWENEKDVGRDRPEIPPFVCEFL